MTQARHKLLSGCTCCGPVVVLGRREFVAGGLAALGLGAFAASGIDARAQTPAKPHRIDVHHHISPPTWLDAVKKAKLDNPPLANWSTQKSLDDMDKAGIATAIASPTTPQVTFLASDKDTAARVARESNEYTKKLMSDHPGRFGLFAMLPLPNRGGGQFQRRRSHGDRARERAADHSAAQDGIGEIVTGLVGWAQARSAPCPRGVSAVDDGRLRMGTALLHARN